ncbi:hypothetical protein HHO41_11665 [Bacillus sp. DNRA2]|uniref:hypothetical protein n=1 Tax=Bacillus sp. DNRA2 TaxID=2723053 RepID=UPI00145F2222|nr:hypothetical protein [Bacillus sp. DNRA2]NMD70952.1 hypothetical protein [Bacillus sp. DNRA2]
MKKILLIAVLALSLLPVFSTGAEASYLHSGDQKISINTGLNLSLPLNTGALTFQLQEGLHCLVTNTTGVEIDHSYIWVELDGENVLGIDPPHGLY